MAKGRRRARSFEHAIPYLTQDNFKDWLQMRSNENQVHPKSKPISGNLQARYSNFFQYCGKDISVGAEIRRAQFWNNREAWVHALCCDEVESDMWRYRPIEEQMGAAWSRPAKEKSTEPSDEDWFDDLPFP